MALQISLKNCLKTVPDENNSIDEMMVSWKENSVASNNTYAESQIRGV